ncbi:hypothetical protein LTR56_002985 [Elasticomyces elasticus]|nr:hypothetical protein LTR22_014708 [Elasticomyces elasticus]KAK3656637.1 hypothetical protein LTR56_002985 [Elasticomyces elasticus]KAK4930769.1 hypothetical protein LTR49_002857 [Elasticomyces elasticus]
MARYLWALKIVRHSLNVMPTPESRAVPWRSYGTLGSPNNDCQRKDRREHKRFCKQTDSSDGLGALDEAITKGQYGDIRRKVIECVTNGGTLILTGHFSGMAVPPAIRFFGLGFPWKTCDYHRTHLRCQSRGDTRRHQYLGTLV